MSKFRYVQSEIEEMISKLEAKAEELEVERDNATAGFQELYGLLAAKKVENHRLRSDREKMLDALIWCSGSADFAPGGKAHVGWVATCRPLIERLLAQEES